MRKMQALQQLLADGASMTALALRMVETLHSMWSDQTRWWWPIIRRPITPIYYVKGETPLRKALDAVGEVIRKPTFMISR